LQSSPDHIIRTSSGGTTIENVREPGAARIRYGSIVTDFSSGDSVTVKPCTIDGIVDTAAESFTVYLMPDQSSVDLTSVTIAGASATASACELPEDSVIAYQYGSDGNYIVGEPVYFISDLRYDTTSHKIQAKVQWLVGTVASVESEWLDVREATEVTGVITAWQVDSTSGEVQKKTRTIYALEAGTESAAGAAARPRQMGITHGARGVGRKVLRRLLREGAHQVLLQRRVGLPGPAPDVGKVGDPAVQRRLRGGGVARQRAAAGQQQAQKGQAGRLQPAGECCLGRGNWQFALHHLARTVVARWKASAVSLNFGVLGPTRGQW
jgi:hypothetical protein